MFCFSCDYGCYFLWFVWFWLCARFGVCALLLFTLVRAVVVCLDCGLIVIGWGLLCVAYWWVSWVLCYLCLIWCNLVVRSWLVRVTMLSGCCWWLVSVWVVLGCLVVVVG